MKTGVVFSNVKYYVNEEKKVVVCTMNVKYNGGEGPSVFPYEARAKAEKKFGGDIFYNTMFTKGIAKCSDEDTFDVTLGKRIAESKAKKLAFNHVFDYITYCIQRTDEMLDNEADFANNCSFAAAHEETHIKWLLGEKEEI